MYQIKKVEKDEVLRSFSLTVQGTAATAGFKARNTGWIIVDESGAYVDGVYPRKYAAEKQAEYMNGK